MDIKLYLAYISESRTSRNGQLNRIISVNIIKATLNDSTFVTQLVSRVKMKQKVVLMQLILLIGLCCGIIDASPFLGYGGLGGFGGYGGLGGFGGYGGYGLGYPYGGYGRGFYGGYGGYGRGYGFQRPFYGRHFYPPIAVLAG